MWSLLPDWACEILMQCATFVGGFNLAQAKGVIDLSNFPEPPVEEALEDLMQPELLYRAMAPELQASSAMVCTAWSTLRQNRRCRAVGRWTP